jgi:hypothetical protein
MGGGYMMRRTAKCNSLCVGTTKCTSRRMVHMVDSIARCTESAHNEPAIVSSRSTAMKENATILNLASKFES